MPENAYWLRTIAEGVAAGIWLSLCPLVSLSLVVLCVWLIVRRSRWR